MSLNNVLIILPCQNLDDLSAARSAEDCEELLTAWTAAFHPAVIAESGCIHSWADAENPPHADGLEQTLVFLPKSSELLLSDSWIDEAARSGAVVIRNLSDRQRTAAEVLALLSDRPPTIDPEIVADFFALGFCHFIVELLTSRVHYTDGFDEQLFERHVVEAAVAAIKGDAETVDEQLQTAFDQLTESREFCYPSEASLIDLTLVAESTLDDCLVDELRRQPAANLLICGKDLEVMAQRKPETLAALRQALAEQTCAIVGGEQNAMPLALMPAEAMLADVRRGLGTYERLLGQSPKIFARRRFGLTPMSVPVIAALGFRGALHISLDAGRFPTAKHGRILWHGAGGASIDALAVEALDASKPETFLALPEKLGELMSLDYGPALVFAHWPGRACRWYEDLQRMGRRSPVLGRFDELAHYFEEYPDAGHGERYAADAYRSAYLQQAVAAGQANPISRWVVYYRRRTAADAICGLEMLVRIISPPCEAAQESKRERSAELLERIDAALESNNDADDDLDRRLEALLAEAAGDFARLLPRKTTPKQPARLAINPWSFSRNLQSDQPDDSDCLQQPVPAMGYAWLPYDNPNDGEPSDRTNDCDASRMRQNSQTHRTSLPSRLAFWRKGGKNHQPPPLAEAGCLRNEFFKVSFDPASGAILAVDDYHTRHNRLAQQIALRRPGMNAPAGVSAAQDAEAAYSIMAADKLTVARCDEQVGEMFVRGRLVDRQATTVARFAQTTRVRRGSRVIELLIDIEPDVVPNGNPWDCYYAARFAWHDATAEIFREVNSIVHRSESMLLESPRFVDVRGDRSRLTILSGGLPFHRRRALRKLDTLLIVAGERSRSFRMGIGIDLPCPGAAATEFLSPLPVMRETAAPPHGRQGWLFHLDARNVVATAWEPLEEQGRTVGFAVRLLETSGRDTRCCLRSFRELFKAETTDFRGGERNRLAVDDDRIEIDIAAHEWLQIEARWKKP